jgi:hypothetical protein
LADEIVKAASLTELAGCGAKEGLAACFLAYGSIRIA